eukprot:6763241-Heterocapsa_arctica.AAC.1
MRKGVRNPRHGQWERDTIQKLMTTIGGQQMDEQLAAPAHKFSAALSKNMVGGDTTFIHYPRCIVGGSETPSPGRSPQLP